MSQPKIKSNQLVPQVQSFSQIVRVDHDPSVGEFTSIKDAIDSVTTNSPSNQIMILVGPGTYLEDPITLKPYVKVQSISGESFTTIAAKSPTQTVVTGVSGATFDGFSIGGATGVGGIGLYYTPTFSGPANTFRAKNLRFLGNELDCYIYGVATNTYAIYDNFYFVTATSNTITHFKIENPAGGGEMEVLCRRLAVSCLFGSTPVLSESILVTGPNCHANFTNITIQCIGGGNALGDGLVIQDGAHIDVVAGTFIGYDNNIVVRNIGAAPSVHITSTLSAQATVYDVSVEHPGTTGLFTGAANHTKVNIDPTSTVSATYSNIDTDGATIVVGSLYMGPSHATITDYTNLFNESLPTGLLAGGAMTYLSQAIIGVTTGLGGNWVIAGDFTADPGLAPGETIVVEGNTEPLANTSYTVASTTFSGGNTQVFVTGSINAGATVSGTLRGGLLNVSITAGYGYVNILTPAVAMKKVEWNAQVLTIPDNTNSNVYVDSTGAFTTSIIPLDSILYIFLGRVRTEGGAIQYIAPIPRSIEHISTYLDTFLREAIGGIFGTGTIVTENVTPFHLDVSPGRYFYSNLEITPSGATDLEFDEHYEITGTWYNPAPTHVVNNTQYNNTATGLVALTAGYYTKHTLYVAGEGVTERYGFVFGQAEYSTLLDAQQAPLPTPPPYFTDLVIPCAAIIVQQGAANITQFVDIRPRVGFQAPSVSASAVHGDLLGLLNDDHPQYLLTAGTRAMTGGLDMGTHDITNVGNVDGVDISAHAARHLPTGADALTTAAPTTTLTLATSNAEGIANSLARSDHTHAVTVPIAQVLSGTIAGANGTTTIPYDNTAPDITEGTQIWSQSITPRATTSKVSIQFGVGVDCSANNGDLIIALFRGTTCIATRVWASGSGAGDRPDLMSMDFVDSPATTSATTYSARIGTTIGTWYVNSNAAGVTLGGTLPSTYKLMEVLA